jgi:hypothetical protein
MQIFFAGKGNADGTKKYEKKYNVLYGSLTIGHLPSLMYFPQATIVTIPHPIITTLAKSPRQAHSKDSGLS